jgi:uncharacterized membrane protein
MISMFTIQCVHQGIVKLILLHLPALLCIQTWLLYASINSLQRNDQYHVPVSFTLAMLATDPLSDHLSSRTGSYHTPV